MRLKHYIIPKLASSIYNLRVYTKEIVCQFTNKYINFIFKLLKNICKY